MFLFTTTDNDIRPDGIADDVPGAYYRLYTYDVWGNGEDGYDVNDVYRQRDRYFLPDGWSDAQTLAFLESSDGPLKPGKATIANVSDAEVVYIEATDDGKPVCELRRESTDGSQSA